MIRICFVCLGNICRSPMAEFIFKNMVKKEGLENHFFIESKGTSDEEFGNPMHHGTIKELKKNHISYQNRDAKYLKEDDYYKFNYFIGMDSFNCRSMKHLFSEDPELKIFKLLDFSPLKKDIADPWYTNNFSLTYEGIEIGCKYLLNYLIKKENL